MLDVKCVECMQINVPYTLGDFFYLSFVAYCVKDMHAIFQLMLKHYDIYDMIIISYVIALGKL